MTSPLPLSTCDFAQVFNERSSSQRAKSWWRGVNAARLRTYHPSPFVGRTLRTEVNADCRRMERGGGEVA